ncbi:hypothetical protein BD779DRAFT_1530495 [Infundibulicybe gibba]|nr:hypothetical protein BD779DRAFT_1530495 [Infundibulicybe gibba]
MYLFISSRGEFSGWASQWYPAKFTVAVKIGDEAEVVEFPAAEHWMMFQKAMLFSDASVAREVLSITGTSKADMAYVKSLGRKVENFSEDAWVRERERIVLEGTLHKFRQNEALKEKLLATGDRMVVEASPYDKIWGIGMGEKDAISKGGAKWGLNLLGEALVKARTILRETEDST